MSDFITIDRAALKEEVQLLLKGSPLWTQIQGGLVLDVKHPEACFGALGDLVQNVLASVEIVKANFVKEHDPDGILGLKFDSHLAFDLALEILDEAVKFGGVFGPFIEVIDRPLLKFFVEVGVAAWRGKDWLVVARTILMLAV